MPAQSDRGLLPQWYAPGPRLTTAARQVARVSCHACTRSTASDCPRFSPPRPTAHFSPPFFWVAAGGVSVILVRPKEIACGELREALEQYDRDPKATGQLCVVVCPQLEPIGLWTLDGPRWSKVLVLHAVDLIETTPELFDAHRWP